MDSPSLSITLLGAGQEVGRSCCVLKYRGRTVVCDAGVHPAYSGMASLPFVDELDWSSVDALLITHFHLDHAASLTYIMEKTNFRDGKGKVYMTHPTKAVYKFMMQDFVRMSAASTDALFTPLDLSMSLSSIITVSAHQVISPCPGVTFTPYHAGHVLGACMYHIDIAGVKILYTGDYSREEDRHLVKAEIPPIRPDVLIVESTYGVQSVGNREEKEGRFLNLIHEVVKRGGHALLPVFALGRAQELLLVLDDYWAQHPELHSIPIYYASNLARKCMAVYQTYIHTMNANIRQRFARRDNPFIFKHISHLPQTRGLERKIADGPPCVVLASPGMLQSGTSRELLELWAPDPRNALVITGYSVEGTLARDILNDPDEIHGLRGNTIPRRLSVHYISFSAHVDYAQNSEFIELIKAQHVVLVHGEQNNMGRLRAALQSRYKDRDEDIKIHTPRNLETLRLSFRGEKVAKAIGSLALQPQQPGTTLSGLLVSKDYSYTLLQPHDLRDFAGLSTSSVTQRQRIAIGCGFELVKWHLLGMFGTVDDVVDEGGNRTLRIMGAVDVKHTKEFEVTLEWDSSASNDMIADSVLALILGIDASPASVKMTTHPHAHPHPHADAGEDEWEPLRARRTATFLEAHFGDVELVVPDEKLAADAYLIIRLDDAEAQVHVGTMTVTSENDALRRRIESVLEMALATTTSLGHSYTAGYISEYPQDRSESNGGAKLEEGPGEDASDEEEDKPLEVIG
ncbi:Metallo-hydrolase/oxidoreductase [Exidia glandulosa HHB12029]|uniref:Endoribonuclease YSH1 n=1 Tax=Exidia glandulosa HHB12029 TaxID=1314781 RepID=A0A165CI52_EXIGL|nr:Metallo-hydrolase/oxidoreductase [Exidia glandulosa HHB12029]